MKQQLKSLYFKHQVLIWPIASIIFCLILLIVLIIPSVVKYRKANEQINELKQQSSELSTKVAALQKINPDTAKQNLDILNRALPADRDLPGAIGQVQGLAGQKGIQVTEMTFSSASTDDSKSESFQVKIQILGNLQATKDFVASIKSQTRIMRVSDIEMDSNRQGNDSFSTSINLLVFYKNFPPRTLGVDDKIQELSDKDQALIASIRKSASADSAAIPPTVSGPTGKADPFQ